MEKGKNIFQSKYMVPILALFACFLWGSAFPVLKISYREMALASEDIYGKMLFAGYRFLLASLFLIGWKIFSKRGSSLKVKKEDLPFLIRLGLLQTTLQYFFFYIGLANTSSVKSSILNSLGTFFIVVVSHFLYQDDRLNLNKTIGLVVGFLGVIIINLKGDFNFSFKFIGEGFIILSAVTSTIAAIMVKNSRHELDRVLLTAYQMFIGSLILIFIALFKISPFSLNFTFKGVLLIIYLAFVSAAAFGIWFNLIKYNRLGYISIYRFSIPVSGALLSALMLAEETLSFRAIIALIMVSFGIIMINRREKRA
ncbi:MAG TPA: DMT family transporter [Halanaerobiaceae bacterium]|nr:DMT family transporter [Halanaerobiaceae bacterium]